MEQKKMNVIGKIWWVIYPPLMWLGFQLVAQIIFIIIAFVIGINQGTITPGTMPDMSYESSFMKIVMYGTTTLSGILTILFGLIFMNRDSKVHGLVRDKAQPSSALSWVAIVIISVSFLWISAGVTQLTGDYSPAHQETIDMLTAMGRGYYIVFGVISAPFLEEILCRGLIFKRLRSFFGFLPAALISAAIFGVLHGNIVQGIYATLIGVVFAYIYEKKQSLSASIIAHFIVNGTNTALMFLPEEAALKFTEFYQGINMIIVTIIAVIICAAGIFLFKKAMKDIPAWQVKVSA